MVVIIAFMCGAAWSFVLALIVFGDSIGKRRERKELSERRPHE